MEQLPPDTWRRIGRLLSGELPEEEAERLRAELGDDPEAREALRQAERIWSHAGDAADPEGDWDASQGWEATRRRIGEDVLDRPGGAGGGRDGSGTWTWRWGGWVAAALVAAVAGSWLAGVPFFPGAGPPDVRTYATSRAETMNLRLSDGSVVEVGPESRLTVPGGYGEDERTVRLQGLAFFAVEPSPGRPFTVEADGASVRAVGTEFAVRAFAADSARTVVVKEGRIRLGAAGGKPGAGREVRAGEEARVLGGGVSVVEVDVERRLGWRRGRLAFDGARLRAVLRELERWYRADFELARPELGARRFTGEFAGEPIGRVAEVLSSSLGVRHRVRDDTVVIGSPR